MRLSGKTAVVTGGAGLLGSKFAEALATAGATVSMLDVNVDRLNDAANPLQESLRDKIIPVICDITNEEQTNNVIDEIAGDGSIDILVNSAAMDPKFDIDSVEDGDEVGAFTS